MHKNSIVFKACKPFHMWDIELQILEPNCIADWEQLLSTYPIDIVICCLFPSLESYDFHPEKDPDSVCGYIALCNWGVALQIFSFQQPEFNPLQTILQT